jgi:hypothetical protein
MSGPRESDVPEWDPFFSIPDDRTWNACIGPQGDEENYVDGYIDAALELAKLIIEKDMFVDRDTLILPILYNARHGVELSLKYAIHRLHSARIIGDLHQPNHNVESHWKHLQNAGVGDEELRTNISDLTSYITSLSSIDEDGQQLRYATNVEGVKSLQGKPLANIAVIRDSLESLRALLRRMKGRIQEICAEHVIGTHTRECSRKDLMQIASLLPPKTEWTTAAFDVAKQTIRTRYGLSSNKFCTAVNAIQSNREMRAKLGLESKLMHLSDAHARHVIHQWSLLHAARDKANYLGLDYSIDRNWSAIVTYSKQKTSVVKAILHELSADDFADVETVYYLGRDGQLSEEYETQLLKTKQQYELENDLTGKVNHILTKTNLLRYLAKGLLRIGKLTLADELATIRPDMM